MSTARIGDMGNCMGTWLVATSSRGYGVAWLWILVHTPVLVHWQLLVAVWICSFPLSQCCRKTVAKAILPDVQTVEKALMGLLKEVCLTSNGWTNSRSKLTDRWDRLWLSNPRASSTHFAGIRAWALAISGRADWGWGLRQGSVRTNTWPWHLWYKALELSSGKRFPFSIHYIR